MARRVRQRRWPCQGTTGTLIPETETVCYRRRAAAATNRGPPPARRLSLQAGALAHAGVTTLDSRRGISIEFSRARSLETYRSSNHGGPQACHQTSGQLRPWLDAPAVVSAAGGPRHRVTATSPDSHDGTCPLLGGESSWWRVGSLAHSVLLVSSRAPRRASHDTAESKGPSRIVHDQSAAGATRIQRANPRLIPYLHEAVRDHALARVRRQDERLVTARHFRNHCRLYRRDGADATLGFVSAMLDPRGQSTPSIVRVG